MDFGVSCLLFLLSVIGIVYLWRLKCKEKRKVSYIVGMIGLAIVAAAAAIYVMITIFFVNSIL